MHVHTAAPFTLTHPPQMAEAEQYLGNTTGAARLHSLSANISAAMNKYLWAGDHYVTQGSRKVAGNVGSDPGVDTLTYVDMVDFDSNLLAVAAGVTSADQAAAVLAKIDSYACALHRPTYVRCVSRRALCGAPIEC